MISVSEARLFVKENSLPGRITTKDLINASGLTLAESVHALTDTPPFNQSAVDGYAFAFSDHCERDSLIVVGEIQAGSNAAIQLKPGEAIRIFTGSPVPYSADTVVMQERVVADGSRIKISDEDLRMGSNVRLKGTQTLKGNTALPAGQKLTPAAISFLAGTGLTKVNVFSPPSIRIIVTGRELVKDISEASGGKIIESISAGLVSALKQFHISTVSLAFVDDIESDIVSAVQTGMKADFVILTGGVSVGDYDLVPSALHKCGVQKIFHMVKQKPGKPLYFGRAADTLFFALPGNPGSALNCFYEYVMPSLSAFMHSDFVNRRQFALMNGYKKNPGMTFFLRGLASGDSVRILDKQESHLLSSFAVANCIIELTEDVNEYAAGDTVSVTMID